DDIRLTQRGQAQPFGSGAGDFERIVVRFERDAEEALDLRVVLDHEDARDRPLHGGGVSASSGRLKRNSTPPSGRLRAAISPPCASTIVLQIARPRPKPLCADSSRARWNL